VARFSRAQYLVQLANVELSLEHVSRANLEHIQLQLMLLLVRGAYLEHIPIQLDRLHVSVVDLEQLQLLAVAAVVIVE